MGGTRGGKSSFREHFAQSSSEGCMRALAAGISAGVEQSWRSARGRIGLAGYAMCTVRCERARRARAISGASRRGEQRWRPWLVGSRGNFFR